MARAKSRKKVVAGAPVPPLQVAPENWAARSEHNAPLSWFKNNPRNARTHGAAQIDELTLSIAEHGMLKVVIVADSSGMLWAGHGTVKSLKRFGAQIDKVPFTLLPDGTPEAVKRKFMLRDNTIPLNAGWDRELLEVELAQLGDLDVDLKVLGFSQAELDRMLVEPEREGLTPGDAEQPEPATGPAVSRAGDLWQLGPHRLLCGDCTKPDHVAAVLAGERPLLMVTDPPYGVDYDPDWRNGAADGKGKVGSGKRAVGKVANDTRFDWTQAWELFGGDVAYVWHADRFASSVEAQLLAAEFEVRYQIVWAKERHVIGRGDYHYQHEACWYAVRKGATGHWAGDRSQTTLWNVAHRKSETGHGTQKPIECMKRPIVNNSRAGDAIYEPFSGSGTTIIAAEMTGRRCLAIEIDPAYVDVAVRRWEQFTGMGAILASGGGERWAAVAAARGVKLAA